MLSSSAPRPFDRKHGLARNVRRAFFVPLHVGSALWLVGALKVLWQRPLEYPQGTCLGLFAALLTTLAVSAPIAGLAALLTWLANQGSSRTPPLKERAHAFLRDFPDVAARDTRSSILLAAPPLLVVYMLGSYFIGSRLIVGMANPTLTALAVLALHLALGLLVAVAFPSARGLGWLLSRGLSRLPLGVGRAFDGPARILGWLASGGLLAAAAFVYRFREPLSYLPFDVLFELTLVLFLALVYGFLTTRLSARALFLPRALATAAALAALASSFLLTPHQTFARRVAAQSTLAGQLSYGALLATLDHDADGHLSFLGGGDCAPRDASRNPGALEIPDNRIDEDCDGHDLSARSLPKMGVYNYPVPAKVPKRPPIVLITVDAFAASHLKSFGGKRETTPNLDAFAKRSVSFSHCFSQGPSTRLSFPSIFSSRWDSQIKATLVGRHPFPIEGSERLLAESLHTAGYETSAVVSDRYFSRGVWKGLTQGFDRVVESPYTDLPRLPHTAARVTDAAIAELSRESVSPRFLWAHYFDAHVPPEQPESVPAFGKTRSDIYDAELVYVDREVGRLLAHVESQFQGQALIIITGDHGIAFDAPRHERFNYGYDLSTAVLHVPLIVHAPFLVGKRIEGVVSTMDITPTIVNLLRLPGPLPFEGVSLVPELFTGKASRPALLMHQMFLHERLWKKTDPLVRVSLRTDRFNLVHDRQAGLWELYDWKSDYWEKRDLANNPVHENTLHELRDQLLLLSYDKRFISKEPTKIPAATAPKAPVRGAAPINAKRGP